MNATNLSTDTLTSLCHYNVVGGARIPESLLFVNAKDTTEDMDIVRKNEGQSSSRALRELY